MRTETIYIPLLEAGEGAWRAVQAERRAEDLYLILSKNDDPESESWQFHSGSLVRCEQRILSGQPQLVAVALMPPRALRLVK